MCNNVEDKFLKVGLLAKGECICFFDLLPNCPPKGMKWCVLTPGISENTCFPTYSLSTLTKL